MDNWLRPFLKRKTRYVSKDLSPSTNAIVFFWTLLILSCWLRIKWYLFFMASPWFLCEKPGMCSLAYIDGSNTNKLQVSDFKRRDTNALWTLKSKWQLNYEYSIPSFEEWRVFQGEIQCTLNRINFTYLLTDEVRQIQPGQKKRSKGLIPPFLSHTAQLISCFMGAGKADWGWGRPSFSLHFFFKEMWCLGFSTR